MGIGTAKGEGGARAAAEAAIKSPLLEASIEGARGVLFNITGGKELSLFDVTEASNIITEAVDAEANIIFGAVINEELEDEIRVTVIATGFERRNPAVGARGAARPSYNNAYAQQHGSEKQPGCSRTANSGYLLWFRSYQTAYFRYGNSALDPRLRPDLLAPFALQREFFLYLGEMQRKTKEKTQDIV